MGAAPSDRCGYTWPENHNIGDFPNQQSSCWRRTHSADANRCLWHSDLNQSEKSHQELLAISVDSDVREQCSGYSELLDGAILSGESLIDKISFKDVAMRNSRLSGVNLSGAELVGVDLFDAEVWGADLSGANLSGANLKKGDFRNADLPGSNLKGANLSESDLIDADISGASLQGANLTSADIREANLDNVSVTGHTTCKRLYEGYDGNPPTGNSLISTLQRLTRASEFGSSEWEATARSYHEFKIILSEHGMVGKARIKHLQQRRARRLEAKASNGWLDFAYLGSLISRLFTGYGVRVHTLVSWMLILFVLSTTVYVANAVEDSLIRNISYSVLAFTVAPPKIPTGLGTQIVMMIETFFGTLSIVLLGYILGNRERI